MQKAETEAIKLSYSQNILTDKVKDLLLAKANAEASKLKREVKK